MAGPSAGGAPASPPPCSGCRAPIATSARCARPRSTRSTRSVSPTSPDAHPATLPYPVQKRVALARALVGRPRLILLDEPAGGLGGDDMRRARRADPRPARATWRCCSSSTTWTSSCRCATASSCWTSAGASRRARPAEVRADQRVLDAYLGVEVDAARLRDSRPPTARSARWTASPSRCAGQHHGGPGRQRRGQDVAAAHALGARPARAGRIRLDGPQHRRAARRGDRPPRDGARARGTRRHRRAQRRGEPAAGRAVARRRRAATAWPSVYELFPPLAERRGSRPARCPAASARCSSSAAR